MTRACDNCGSEVSDQYARVVGPVGEVPACPWCEDRIPSAIDEGGFRDVIGTRYTHGRPMAEEETA